MQCERACRKLSILEIWLARRVSCQLICPLDSGKRRPPWPAAWPAEPTDAMARAEGPALPGPLPGLLQPPGWGGPGTCHCPFSLAQGLPLHT